MPVNTEHSEYTEHAKNWRKIRITLEGEEDVKQYASSYVPKPRGFDGRDDLWQEYLQRGEWFPASARTVVGLLGAMFRRAPVVDLPKAFEGWKNTITQNGMSIENFCKLCSKEEIEIGRFGILVDMPEAPPGYSSLTKKSRPYLAGYCAEQIINWAESTVEDPQNPGVFLTLPSLVVLKECVTEPVQGDRFSRKEVEQLRALYLDEQGFYVAEVWQKLVDASGKTSEDWILINTVEPRGPTGKRLSFIPFVFVSPENQTSEIERSPIEDLVSINWSHFNTALDLEWSCHLTACPTIYVTGYKSKSPSLFFGSGVAWEFESPETELGILEYQGKGIDALENRAKVKEDKMAKLGANLLRSKSKQPETAETTRIEHSAESSILSMVARNTSAAVTKALQWAVWWASGLEAEAKKAKVEQNTEFYDARLTSQELDSLTKAVQAGTMPVSVYVFNLIRGDMVPAGTNQKELEAEVQDSLEQPRGMGSFGGSPFNVDKPGGADQGNPPPSNAKPEKAPPTKTPDKAPGSPGKA